MILLICGIDHMNERNFNSAMPYCLFSKRKTQKDLI